MVTVAVVPVYPLKQADLAAHMPFVILEMQNIVVDYMIHF